MALWYFLAWGVLLPIATYGWGTWILWRGERRWRPVGLWFVCAPLAVLLFASWVTAFTIGVVLLPVPLVLIACAVGSAVAMR